MRKRRGRDARVSGRASAAELAAAIRSGSRDAERELVEQYGSSLRYVIGRHSSDPHVAEDLFQETVLVAISRLRERSLAQPDKLGPFLLGIARRLTLAHYRRQSRYLFEEGALVHAADQGMSPEDCAAMAQEVRHVREALNALKVRRDRDVLKRFYVMGQDREAVCRELDLSPSQLTKILHRARLRLRKQIEEEWNTPRYRSTSSRGR